MTRFLSGTALATLLMAVGAQAEAQEATPTTESIRACMVTSPIPEGSSTREHFRSLDQDGDGTVTRREYLECFRAHGVEMNEHSVASFNAIFSEVAGPESDTLTLADYEAVMRDRGLYREAAAPEPRAKPAGEGTQQAAREGGRQQAAAGGTQQAAGQGAQQQAASPGAQQQAATRDGERQQQQQTGGTQEAAAREGAGRQATGEDGAQIVIRQPEQAAAADAGGQQASDGDDPRVVIRQPEQTIIVEMDDAEVTVREPEADASVERADATGGGEQDAAGTGGPSATGQQPAATAADASQQPAATAADPGEQPAATGGQQAAATGDTGEEQAATAADTGGSGGDDGGLVTRHGGAGERTAAAETDTTTGTTEERTAPETMESAADAVPDERALAAATAETPGEGGRQPASDRQAATDRQASDGEQVATDRQASDQQASESQQAADAAQDEPVSVAYDDIVGEDVVNAAGEEIGSIEDILLDPSTGRPVVVVSAGGFLGIGDTEVVFDYDLLEVEGDRVVIDTRLSEESVEEAQGYEEARYQPLPETMRR